MVSDPAELSAFLLKREQGLYTRLLLHRVFQGKVSDVVGTAPLQSVRVVKTGEDTSDGALYPVVSAWDPAIGDLCDIIWRDETFGLAAFPVSSAALSRFPARHPYRCRVYWSGSLGLTANSFIQIPYNNVDYDPWSMSDGSGLVNVPVDGTYLIVLRAGTSTAVTNLDITTGIWRTPAGGAAGQIAQGSRGMTPSASLGNASVCVGVHLLGAGDQLAGYIWTNTAGSGAALHSGTLLNYFDVCLLSR